MTDIPEILTRIIKSFNDKSRREIALAIYEAEQLSWSDLKRKFVLQNGALNYHLKGLQKAGLVENILSYGKDGNEFSFYKSTRLLEKTLIAFREIITPGDSEGFRARKYRDWHISHGARPSGALYGAPIAYGISVASTYRYSGTGDPKTRNRKRPAMDPTAIVSTA